jgi:hypothetical protein
MQNFLKYVRAAAMILLIGFCAASAVNGFQTAAEASSGMTGDDMVTAWDKRLRKIRPLLPEYGVIGYLADWDIPGAKYGSSDQEVEFLLAQYTVAPVVLERGPVHSIILGNFGDNGDPNKLKTVEDTLGIRLTQSYSNEVNIFEGVGK